MRWDRSDWAFAAAGAGTGLVGAAFGLPVWQAVLVALPTFIACEYDRHREALR